MAAPRAIVLGTAQDGGFPHAGCRCARCQGARADPRLARRVACLGLVAGGGGFLVDATPDLPRQLEALPRLSGILLTHAHMGHVAGLLYLGREAMAVRRLPVWAPAGLHAHLARHEPWATLVTAGHVEPRIVEPGRPEQIAPGLEIEGIPVVHRAEWSETVAYRIRGPNRSILWLPDVDRFADGDLERLLDGVDVAFLDGTFFSDDELPGRNLAEIPHPRIRDTAERLAELRPSAAVSFVHLNHSNPCLDPASPESKWLADIFRRAGLRTPGDSPIAPDGLALDL